MPLSAREKARQSGPRQILDCESCTLLLREALKPHGIEYAPLRALGGLRHARQDSPNTGWRNTSFRGYADYMQTEEFAHGLGQLIALSRQQCTAIMCAEAVPWRCHRSLVADALSVRGVAVI